MINNHFNVIVVGDNPDEIIEKYDKKKIVPAYYIYEFSKAEQYHKQYIEMYEEAAKKEWDDENMKEGIQLKLEELKNEDDIAFYMDLTNGYDIDQTTGNAVSTENPNGKYDTCKVGGRWAIPLITNDGKEVYSALKKEIDFSSLHLANTLPYEVAWETVVEGRKPANEKEETIYENMKNRTTYFQQFKNKKAYVSWSTAFWAYAFVDKNGWLECDGGFDQQIDWVENFYDRFIKKLKKNDKITIYECTRF